MLKDILVNFGLSKTNQEVIDYLNEDVILSIDNNLYTISQVKLALNDLNSLRLVLGTLKAASDADPLVWGFSQKVMSTGISFADQTTQDMLDQLAVVGNWSNAIRDNIKAIGIKYGKQYIKLGLDNLPTTDEIDNARNIATFRIWAESNINLLYAAINGEQSDISSYKTQIMES